MKKFFPSIRLNSVHFYCKDRPFNRSKNEFHLSHIKRASTRQEEEKGKEWKRKKDKLILIKLRKKVFFFILQTFPSASLVFPVLFSLCYMLLTISNRLVRVISRKKQENSFFSSLCFFTSTLPSLNGNNELKNCFMEIMKWEKWDKTSKNVF